MSSKSRMNFGKAMVLTGSVGLFSNYFLSSNTFLQMNQRLAMCQAGISDFDNYGGRLTTLNHIGAVKHLMSQLRDKTTGTA